MLFVVVSHKLVGCRNRAIPEGVRKVAIEESEPYHTLVVVHARSYPTYPSTRGCKVGWTQERKGHTSPRDGGRDEGPHLGAGKAGNGRDGLAGALCVD